MACEEFNVICRKCGNFWSPANQSDLWLRAKKRAEAGYLDALCVRAEECGCVQPIQEPNALYRVSGYDDEGLEFDMPFESFTRAVKAYRDASRMGTAFISGVSSAVEARLNF